MKSVLPRAFIGSCLPLKFAGVLSKLYFLPSFIVGWDVKPNIKQINISKRPKNTCNSNALIYTVYFQLMIGQHSKFETVCCNKLSKTLSLADVLVFRS